jgi:hypothetical protein
MVSRKIAVTLIVFAIFSNGFDGVWLQHKNKPALSEASGCSPLALFLFRTVAKLDRPITELSVLRWSYGFDKRPNDRCDLALFLPALS